MTSLMRRDFLRLGLCATAAPILSRSAAAQGYPARPLRLVVGFAPGGAADILARLIAEWLSRRLGRPVVVENRIGGGGTIATEMALRSPADGYTLLVSSSANVFSTQHDKIDFVRDSAAIAMIGQEPIILSINPSLPARTLAEFIAYAKENPGKLSMASPGNGTVPHVAGELFKLMTGVDMAHVPYRGGAPALTDLKAGKIRALAVTSELRAPALPDIPAAAEVVPGYEASQWFGIVAPRGTSADIVDRLNSEINAGLADTRLRARLVELGETVVARSADEFAQRMAADAEKWADVIRKAHISI
jgi:tripartite-type tricarboxylate transporter receptor subunit TctC